MNLLLFVGLSSEIRLPKDWLQPTKAATSQMKPPPASRRRVVLHLKAPVRLYQMQNGPTNETIRSFVTTTMNARPSMSVSTITTDVLRDIDDDGDYQELQVLFFASSVAGPSQESTTTTKMRTNVVATTIMKLSYFLVIPRTWTPRQYLAVLSLSLKTYHVLSVETIQINGKSYLSINDVDQYFHLPETESQKMLIESASYANVSGGIL